MENINDIIKRRQMERKAALSQGVDKSKDALHQANELRDKFQQKREADERKRSMPSFNGDAELAANSGDKDYMQQKAGEMYTEKFAPTQDFNAYETQEVEGSQDMDWFHENWASKIGKSLVNGTGDVVKGLGDVLQMATSLGYMDGMEGWSDNPLQFIGDVLHEQGAMDTRQDLDMSKEMDISDLLANPNFWLTEVPKVLPQIADTLFIGRGIGGAAKKGLQTVGKKALLKEVVEEGAEQATKQAARYSSNKLGRVFGEVKGTTQGVYQGALRGANESVGTGSGVMSRVFTDTGKFTKTFDEVAGNVLGGAAMNVKLGLQNGTEVYNTYSNLKDKDGNNVFTPEEAGEMARNTLLNQSQYIAADIASYMLVFGKNSALKPATAKLPEELGRIGKLFAQSQKYLPTGLAKVAGKAGFEGVEESFQESWEEWAKAKAYFDKVGSFDNYQGNLPEKIRKSKGELIGNFWDYYSSDENKTIRNMSGILGAFMGGSFNIKDVFNKSADNAYNMYNRAESLSRMSAKGTEDDAAKIHHINSTMSEMIMQKKEDLFVPFISHLHNKGIITDEDLAYYQGNFDKLAMKANEVRSISSLNGKVAFMENYAEELASNDHLNSLHANMKEAIEFHKNNISDPELRRQAIKREADNFKAAAQIEAQKAIFHQNNQQQLLAGKPATLLESTIDPDMATDVKDNGDWASSIIASERNKLRKQAEAKINEVIDNDNDIQSELNPNGEPKTFLDKAFDTVDKVKAKAGEFVSKVTNKTKEELEKYKADREARKYDSKDISEVDQESYDNFKKDGSVTSSVLNGLAKKTIDKTQLTEQEQEIYNANKDVISAKVSHYNSPEVQAKNKLELEKLQLQAFNNLVSNGNDLDSLTDDEYYSLVDENGDISDEVLETQNNNSAAIKSAVDKLVNGGDIEKLESDVISKFPEQFEQLAKAKGIENPMSALNNAVLNSKNFSYSEKDYYKKAAARDAKQSKKEAREKKSLEKKRALDEFKEEFPDIKPQPQEENKFNTTAAVDEQTEESVQESVENQTEEQTENFKKTLREKAEEWINNRENEQLKEFLNKNFESLKTISPAVYKELSKERTKEKFNKVKETGKKLFNSFRDNSYSLINKGTDVTHHLYPPSRLSQVRAAERRLEIMYPNQGLMVSTVHRMNQLMGIPATALTVSGMIFVDTNAWDNNNLDYFHEVSHVHFKIARDTDEVKTLVKELLNNKAMIDHIKENYDDQMTYKINDVFREKRQSANLGKEMTKGQILDFLAKDLGVLVNPDEAFKILEDSGYVTMNPDEQQEVLLDELYAYNMQYAFDTKYKNKYFEEFTDEELDSKLNGPTSNVDKRSKMRKYLERKTGVEYARRVKRALQNFLKSIKAKTEEMIKQEDPELILLEKYLNDLDDNSAKKFSDLKDAAIDSFLKGNQSRNFTNSEIRYKKETKIAEDIRKEEALIADKIAKQNKENIKRRVIQDDEVLNERDERVINPNNDEQSDELSNGETTADALFDKKDRLEALQKSAGLIKQFSKLYNKALRTRYVSQRKPDSAWEIPTFNGDELLVELNDLAISTNSAQEFIRLIENSEYEEMFEFNDFLDTVRSKDKYSYLNSFWMQAKNMKSVDSVQTFVNSDGKVEVQSTMSMREKFQDEKNFQDVVSAISAFRNFTNSDMENYKKTNPALEQYYVSKWDKYSNAIKNIKNNNFTDRDLLDMVNFLGGDRRLLDENTIFIDGKRRALDSVLVHLALNTDINNPSIYQQVLDDNGQVARHKDGKPKYEVNPLLRKTIRGIVVSDRKNKADFTVLNAAGNQVASRKIENPLMIKLDEMNQEARRLKLPGFIKKYSRVKGEGQMSNAFLEHFHKQANSGIDVQVSQFLGIKNAKDGSYNDFSDNNGNDNSINEFLMYLSTGNRTNSYLMDTGRYADSPVSYLMEVPKMKAKDFFTRDSNGNITFKGAQSKYFLNAVKAYNKFLPNDQQLTPLQVATLLENDINAEQEFFKNNITAFKDMSTMQKYLNDDKGDLNDLGKGMVAEYVLNNFVNQTQFNNVMLPDYKGADLGKRQKSLHSAGYNFKNTKFETLYFKDDVEQDVSDEMDNSGMYILEEDAQRIQDSFGELMDLGLGYKLLHAGMEQQNPMFKGKNFYDKGYTTILNEEYVKRNPRLKGLYEAMKARRDKQIKLVGEGNYEQSLTSGNTSHLVLAVPMSANKVKDADGNRVLPKSFTENDKAFTLDDYNENGSNIDSDIHKLWDQAYYNGDQLVGLDGTYLKVQNSLDKVRFKINMPVQLAKFLTTNGSLNGNLSELESIQQDVANLQQEQVQEIVQLIKTGTNSEIKEKLRDYVDDLFVDSLQLDLLNEGLSLNTPALRKLAVNTFLNKVRKNGNKLETPGTIAQQKPSKHVKRATDLNGNDIEVYTGIAADALFNKNNPLEQDRIKKYGGDNLKFYGKNPDGTTKPGEAVIPKYLQGKVKTRKYHIFGNSDRTILDYYANPQYGYDHPQAAVKYANSLMTYAKAEGRIAKSMSVEEYMDNYKVLNSKGHVIGFYVPGDLFMATRVPSHGPQSTGVFEAIDYDTTGASQVQLPSEFSLNTTGGDYDGDQVFMQYKQGNHKFNPILDKMIKQWLSPEMHEEIKKRIEFEDEAKAAIEKIEAQLKKDGKSKNVDGKDIFENQSLIGSPRSRRQAFNDTIVSKNNIGAAANYHSYLSMLASYETSFNKDINIDGRRVNTLSDYSDVQRSRTIDSAKIFNIILDNAKHQFADRLGINEQTVGDALILTNLGFNLEQVGLILNSDKYKEYVSNVASKRNSFAPSEPNMELDSKSDIIIDTKDINNPRNESSLESLIALMSNVKSDMSDLSKVMGGHNRIEVDPFVLSQQIENIETLLDNNKDNQVINISGQLKNNPLVQNYIKVAKDALAIREEFDPVSRKEYKEVYGNITSSSTRNLNDNHKKTIHDDMERVALSRLLGLNNISEDYKKSLTEPGHKNNIFDRVGMIVNDLKTDIVSGNNMSNYVTAYDSNILFSKALSVVTEGNNKFISLRSSFFNDTTSDVEKDLVKKEFAKLDNKLQKDLMLYDMMQNGWEGRKSLFHIMGDSFKQEVSRLSDQDIRTKNSQEIDPKIKQEIEKAIAEKNQDMFDTVQFYPFPVNKNTGQRQLNYAMYASDKGTAANKIWQKIKEGNPTTFFYYDKNTKKKFYIKFEGFTNQQIADLKASRLSNNDKAYFNKVANMFPDMMKNKRFIVEEVKDSYKGDIGYERLTSIKDDNVDNNNPFDKIKSLNKAEARGYNDWLNLINTSDSDVRFKKDFYLFEKKMSEREFNGAMEYPSFVNEADRKLEYQQYLNERAQSEIEYRNINEETISKMDTKEIIEHYNNFSQRNQYAYSNILTPLTKEIAKRIGDEQTEKYTQIKSDGRDISTVQKYFISNNIPSNHPMVQGVVRNMENAFKTFSKEQTAYQNKLQDATNKLYIEQLGYAIKDGSIKDKVKALIDYLFKNKEELYSKLYGPLITYDSVMKKDPQGKDYEMKVMRYKDEEVINKEYVEGNISEAQYNFYMATRAISKDLVQYQDLSKGERKGFIPHVSPGQMEAFSRRGLLGLMNISKPQESALGDVKINFTNPITGEEIQNASMRDVEFFFSNEMIAKGDKTKNAKQLYQLRKKALEFLNKGINEDGSPIKMSDISAGTVMGEVFADRFSNSGSKQSNNFVTMDLNKAFGDYIHSTLFVNGNANFSGMKSMLPMLDGALATLDSKAQNNMKAYVQSIWKDNFLKGAKKSNTWTPNQLKAVGVSSDKVIDYLTRGSLIYWLGYKGLALGAGAYAIGNVLNGKFNNIAHAGGKSWRKGEQRFWLGKNGKFSIKDPMKGPREANQILKEIGFMDINLYDDVSITKQNSLENMLMGFALMPMTYSERWIQGTHFLGLLTDEEWDAVVKDGKSALPVERLNELENTVKLSHGKGYQVTDQRMIQMYSWGRAMMQFSRHIPTVMYNNLAGKDKNIYGKEHIGAYRQVYDVIQQAVVGKMNPKEFKRYVDSLNGEEKRKFYAGLMGFGLLSTAAAVGNSKYMNDLSSDVNIFFDADRLGYKLTTPPVLGMLSKI